MEEAFGWDRRQWPGRLVTIMVFPRMTPTKDADDAVVRATVRNLGSDAYEKYQLAQDGCLRRRKIFAHDAYEKF